MGHEGGRRRRDEAVKTVTSQSHKHLQPAHNSKPVSSEVVFRLSQLVFKACAAHQPSSGNRAPTPSIFVLPDNLTMSHFSQLIGGVLRMSLAQRTQHEAGQGLSSDQEDLLL